MKTHTLILVIVLVQTSVWLAFIAGFAALREFHSHQVHDIPKPRWHFTSQP